MTNAEPEMAKKLSTKTPSTHETAQSHSEQAIQGERDMDEDTPHDGKTTKEDFETLYLQQATREFADELEKLRTAHDFRGERSVQVLVDALKQGTACFSDGEKQTITRQ